MVSSAQTYADFAECEVKGYSPTYFEWANSISQDRDALTLIDQLPPRCQQPNLIFAACRFLGDDPGPYAFFRDFLLTNWFDIADVTLHRRTQTNEPGRCAVLLPLLASLPNHWRCSKLALPRVSVFIRTGTATSMTQNTASTL